MRTWIRRAIPILALLVLLGFGFQLWNVSRQVASLWDYLLRPPAPQVTAEVAALRAQLEVMRQYDQRLLQTVYWALTVIVVIAAALVGFGWYANFRVYERDKALLQQDLRNSLQAAMAKASEALSAETAKTAEQVAKGVTGPLNDRIRNLTHDVRKLQVENVMAEARHWEKTVPANAFLAYAKAAELMLDLPYPDLDRPLDGILHVLEAGTRPDSFALSRLKPVLDRLPAEHADAAKKIRSLAGIPT